MGCEQFQDISGLCHSSSGSPLQWQQSLTSFEPNDGLAIERKIYAFPSYEQAAQTTDVEKYATKQAYEKAVGDGHFELQKLKYMSDGLKVVAYFYKPREVEGKRLPAIIFNHGSAIRSDIAPELVAFFHRLASEGFMILAVMAVRVETK